MKVLVTGGAGFIGSNYINFHLKKYPKDSVTNLDSMTYCANPLTVEFHKKTWGSRYQHILGDITDFELVDSLVKETDLIVHFAAESHVDRSISNPNQFVQTNVIGTVTLLNAALAHGKKRFHHISTDEVYGTLELNSKEKFNETTPFNPRSPYSASKASSDHFVLAYFHTYGLPTTITNCSNNYGPYQFPEKLIPLFITRLSRDLKVPIYGPGLAIRDYLFVEDHCVAIDSVITKGRLGETYCVGGNSEKNTVQVGDTISGILQKPKDLMVHSKDRPGHDPRYAIDFTKIKNELGWEPSVSFEEGIEKTVNWYLENKEWWAPISKKAEEVAENYLLSIK